MGPAFSGKDSVEITAQYDSELDISYYWIRYRDGPTGDTRVLMKIVNGEITENPGE